MIFHWARRSVGPEQFRAFKNPDRNSRRRAQTAATSAVSSPRFATEFVQPTQGDAELTAVGAPRMALA